MKIKYFQNNLSITLCTLLLTSASLFANEIKNEKETKTLESITIIGDDSSNYKSDRKPSVNRTNIELEDMSKSVQIFNQDFIEDFKGSNVQDIATMSSNVVYSGHNRSRSMNFTMRGFDGVTTLRDGLNITDAIPNPEVYNLEAIEILKGPDSLQYGESSPGGLINLVKKKTQREEHGEIVLDINDNFSYSPKFDIGGAINEDGSLRYRLITTYTEDDTQKDVNNKHKRIFIAPSLSYDFNDTHTLNLTAEITDEEKPYDFGVIYDASGNLVHNRETTISHPDEIVYYDQNIFGLDFESTFENFKSNFRYRHVNYKFDLPASYAPFVYTASTNSVTSYYAHIDREHKDNIFQYSLNHKYQGEKFKNNFTIGADYKNSDFIQKTGLNTAQGLTFDLNSGNKNNPSMPSSVPAGTNPFRGGTVDGLFKTTREGLFAQNSLTINDKYVINTGLRYDKVKQTEDTNPSNNNTQDNITPQIGFVYKVDDSLDIYTSYAQSFTPQEKTTRDANGKVLDPETGSGYELGLRKRLLDDSLALNTALFSITKENVAVQVGSGPSAYYEASNKQKSKGFEIDLNGQITPKLAIVTSYGYTKTQDNEGEIFSGVPKHTANLYTSYSFDNNFYIGAGLQYVGKREVRSNIGTFNTKAYTLINTNAGYKDGPFSVNIGIRNLTDEQYLSSVGTYNIGMSSVGEARTVHATLSYKF